MGRLPPRVQASSSPECPRVLLSEPVRFGLAQLCEARRVEIVSDVRALHGERGVLEMVQDEFGRETGLSRLVGYRSYYCYELIFRPTHALPGIQLWREWLTHAAVAARLHLDYGYPRHSLAVEEDAFDVVVHGRHNEPFIAVEVKKPGPELDKMVGGLLQLSRERFDPDCRVKLGNTEKKYRGLLSLQPPILCAASAEREFVFDVTYSHDPASALLLPREGMPHFAGP